MLLNLARTYTIKIFTIYLAESAPSTLMGQFIEALNNQQTQIEEFNLDTFQGGLECNVEEVSCL